MRTTQEHRDLIADSIGKQTTLAMKAMLIEKGLTNTQANDVVRNQRKKAKVYGVKVQKDQ